MQYFLYSSSGRFWQMVQISIGNRGLDILFISEILGECGDWHVVASFAQIPVPQYVDKKGRAMMPLPSVSLLLNFFNSETPVYRAGALFPFSKSIKSLLAIILIVLLTKGQIPSPCMRNTRLSPRMCLWDF